MKRWSVVLIVIMLSSASCGARDGDTSPGEAEQQQSTTKGVPAEMMRVFPIAGNPVSASVSRDERVLVLDVYDSRGVDDLRRELPQVFHPDFNNEDLIMLESSPRNEAEVEKKIRKYLDKGVINEIGFVGRPVGSEASQPFLLTNSARIYPLEHVTKEQLRTDLAAINFRLVVKKRIGRVIYEIQPLDPLADPGETVSAAQMLAMEGLIDEEKTRSRLVETKKNKMR